MTQHHRFEDCRQAQQSLPSPFAAQPVHPLAGDLMTMGWFSSAPPPPKTTADGGLIAPDRTERAQCWQGRDAFFRCLDEHNIIDSVREDSKARQSCGKELAAFEQACKDSWVSWRRERQPTPKHRLMQKQVTYFKKRRVMEYQRDATIKKLSSEGAQGVPMSTPSATGR